MKGRNEQGLKVFAIVIAALTYAGAVVYGDVMFLQVVSKAFPSSGLLQAFAYAGAIVTAISALCLPIALHWWFAPGPQFIWGMAFWFIDIAALGLNSILSYELSTNTLDSTLGLWQIISPATPLLAVIGWGVAFLLDPSHQERHARLEMQADQIDTFAAHLKQASKSEAVYQVLEDAAKAQAEDFARSINSKRFTHTDVRNGDSQKETHGEKRPL